jgi:hypothetical protein
MLHKEKNREGYRDAHKEKERGKGTKGGERYLPRKKIKRQNRRECTGMKNSTYKCRGRKRER